MLKYFRCSLQTECINVRRLSFKALWSIRCLKSLTLGCASITYRPFTSTQKETGSVVYGHVMRLRIKKLYDKYGMIRVHVLCILSPCYTCCPRCPFHSYTNGQSKRKEHLHSHWIKLIVVSHLFTLYVVTVTNKIKPFQNTWC